jgi:hypothetical protein
MGEPDTSAIGEQAGKETVRGFRQTIKLADRWFTDTGLADSWLANRGRLLSFCNY